MKKKNIFWQDIYKLKTILFIFYTLLIVFDFAPIISLFLGIFIFLASVHKMPELERSHFLWLRKTLLIYFTFTGLSAFVFIFSPAKGVSISSIIIFFVGFLWVEFREIKGLICLWQKKDPAQGLRLFDKKSA